jgi:pimeloyl-ACP methyl ester carboxylesterase
VTTPAIVSVGGRRTRVRIEGDLQSPPILLLHGIGRSLEDWAPQYPRLAGSHRVIALDVAGFGFSDRLAERSTLKVLAQSVFDTLDALGERRPFHVVGNSLGGAIALQMSVLDPGRVASLTLADSAGFGPEVMLPLRVLTVPLIGEVMSRLTTRSGALATERMLYANPKLATRYRVDHALAIAEQPDAGVAMLQIARELATWRGVRADWRVKLLADVARNPRPTLIVWGNRDKVLPAHHLTAARRAIPHAETLVFEGVGHAPQIERADEFAERVIAFTSKIDPPASGLRRPPKAQRRARGRTTSSPERNPR